MGGSNTELQDLTNRLIDRARAYGMEVSTEKSKIMTNSTSISADISMNGQKLEEMTSFKYRGATLCKNGTCSGEICIRIASAKAAMASNGRIKQDLVEQHHQLNKQVQVIEVSCHLHPPVWL